MTRAPFPPVTSLNPTGRTRMTAPETRSLEHRMGDRARTRLPFAVAELVMFVLNQGRVCPFGGLLLLVIIATATGTWLYSGQIPGQAVNLAKLGSWYLLLYVAVATVTVVSRGALSRGVPGLRNSLARP